jgi:CheY-like chemotaxis protein
VPLNILLADDSMTAQNMAKKILSEAGYEVTTVSNGAAALKKIAEKTPDLVILDIYMPGYTGLEVCERVKRAATTSNMPVLLSVGKLEPYREQDATDVRADGVIVKPFEATELVTIVTNVILGASGAAMDAATRLPTPPAAIQPVAIQTSPAAEPELLPALGSGIYEVEVPNLESQIQDAGPALTHSLDTVSNRDYPGTSLPLEEEKLQAMAVPTAAAAAAATPDYSAAFGSRAAEANSSMPFMIDELLKADEKAPAEDTVRRFSGPELEVSPVERATEDIEIIDIPAPEPTAGAQVSEEPIPLHVAAPAEATVGGNNIPAEELTAIEVEAFMLEHAAGTGSSSAPAIGVTPDGKTDAQEGAGATAATPNVSDSAGSDEPLPGANAMQALPLEDRAGFRIADDEKSVFEVEDEPFFAVDLTDVMAAAPIVEEYAVELHARKPLVPADIKAQAVAEPALEPAPAKVPAVLAEVPVAQVQDSPAQVPVAQEPEPEPAPAPLPAAMASATEPATATAAEDFMFSVPMMLEATAAMSAPELPDPGSRPVAESTGSSMLGAPGYAAEAARPAALDEAAIAGAVQRVMDRFKPQIVAEIVRELAKRKQ